MKPPPGRTTLPPDVLTDNHRVQHPPPYIFPTCLRLIHLLYLYYYILCHKVLENRSLNRPSRQKERDGSRNILQHSKKRKEKEQSFRRDASMVLKFPRAVKTCTFNTARNGTDPRSDQPIITQIHVAGQSAHSAVHGGCCLLYSREHD